MFGPSPAHRLLRVLVKEDSPLTLEQLVERSGLTAERVKGLLLPLEQRGWVAHLVEPKLSGERAVEECWELSPRGRRRVPEVLEPVPLIFRWLRAVRLG